MSSSTKKRSERKRHTVPPAPKISARAFEIDFRIVSLHEAAHAVLAAHAGFSGTLYISPAISIGEGERAVVGKLVVEKMPPKSAAIVAWAGAIAESIERGLSDFEEFEDDLAMFPPSPSDYALISAVSASLQAKAMETAWDLVSTNWKEITTLAERCRKDFHKNGLACIDINPARKTIKRP